MKYSSKTNTFKAYTIPQKKDPMATADPLVSAVMNQESTGAMSSKSVSQLQRSAATNATTIYTKEKTKSAQI